MTKAEVGEEIHRIIQAAVERGGGKWRLSYAQYVDRIFVAMGKLTPEPKEKPQVPPYNQKKVKRVGTLIQRTKYTKEQSDAAVQALRAVGLL